MQAYLGNVRDEPKEDQGPQVSVGQRILDVRKADLVVKGGQSLGGIVPKHPVDHDLLLTLGEPRLAEENTGGFGRAFGQPAVGKDSNDTGQGSFKSLKKESAPVFKTPNCL